MTDLEELREGLQAVVCAAYARANRESQLARSALYALSMSGLGGCVRQAAYRLSGTPPTDVENSLNQEARAAMHGTWIHEGLLPHLAHFLGEDLLARAVHELRVELKAHGVAISGSADLYTDAFGGGILDLKTIYAHGLDHLGDSPKAEHWWQVMGYATAVAQSGRPVEWVAWLYADRSTGEALPMIVPYGEAERAKVLERIEMLVTFAQDPDTAPRANGAGGVMPGPGDDNKALPCNGCPWLRECFGPQAKPGDPLARRRFAEEQERGVEWAMRGYHEAHKLYAQAKGDKEFYLSVVKASQPIPGATYGEFQYSLGQPYKITDTKEAERRLEVAGIPVPKKMASPRTYIRPAR